MRKNPNADLNLVAQIVDELIDNNLRNIPCKLHNNITHETIETSMVDTFEWIENRNPIITGNGTFFKQHSEYLAPTVKMLEKLQANRKKKKKEMYQYQKGSVEYTNANIQQLSIKVIMNADYGGSGTPLSPFYSCYLPPATTGSAKNMTTSLICCLELLSGNKNQWAKLNNINELFDLIYIVLEDKKERPNRIHAKFSVKDVLNHLAGTTNNLNVNDINVLRGFLESLTDDELSKLMFAMNIRLVLREYTTSQISVISNYLIDHQIDIENITTETLQECGYGVTPPEEIKGLIEEVSEIVLDNCVYPFVPNDAEVRAANMKRLIVCVTDTDSLMVHFSHYLDEFQAHTQSFRGSCLVASAFGMRLFIEHIIPQMVADITGYCNINDKYYRDKFVFKNEFGFLSMALFAKKMYATSMFVQEGSPRNPHDISVSGMAFKKRDSAEFLEPIMIDMFNRHILTTENISISGVLDDFYALRNKLLHEVGHDPSYYKVLSIKDISAYDPTKVLPAQMRGAIVWNNIMPDEEMLPMDRVTVIPLSFELLKKYKDEDFKIAEILKLSLRDNENEKNNPYICIPEHYHSIPEWIAKVIDVSYAVDKILMPYGQVFAGFDVCTAETPGGIRPARMVFL